MSASFLESDLLPISALQHLIYCPRQCALIHNERLWAENRLTVEGKQLHDKAHDTARPESRPGVRITRGLPLRCFSLGIAGVADVVEFPLHPQAGPEPGEGPDLPLAAPPVPIEYKRGRPKAHDADKVQLCAQALCLEEMLNLPPGRIANGCLFYGKTRRRLDVPLDHALRARTIDTIKELHRLIASGATPAADYDAKKCDRCSLIGLCMPRQLRPRRTAARVFNQCLQEALASQ